jgi:hypothetical protein
VASSVHVGGICADVEARAARVQRLLPYKFCALPSRHCQCLGSVPSRHCPVSCLVRQPCFHHNRLGYEPLAYAASISLLLHSVRRRESESAVSNDSDAWQENPSAPPQNLKISSAINCSNSRTVREFSKCNALPQPFFFASTHDFAADALVRLESFLNSESLIFKLRSMRLGPFSVRRTETETRLPGGVAISE